uniref:Uncharacterized protein n=1 Tax=Rhizophora mucronata TaxID=61149 RepID=A0A2P2IXP3_RHIMU
MAFMVPAVVAPLFHFQVLFFSSAIIFLHITLILALFSLLFHIVSIFVFHWSNVHKGSNRYVIQLQ